MRREEDGRMGGKKRNSEVYSSSLSGLTASGASLAGAKEEAFASARSDAPTMVATPSFAGTVQEYGARAESSAALKKQLQNVIKKCGACGKPCGFSLFTCNGCGGALPEELSTSPNVFMGFVYGVAKAPFPLRISLRMQAPYP